MNFHDKMIELMTQHGMSEKDAKVVMEKLVNDPSFALGTMVNRWGDTVDGYPENMVNILWFSVKAEALIWIEENIPQAWFKPMFFNVDQRNEFLRQNNGEHLIK